MGEVSEQEDDNISRYEQQSINSDTQHVSHSFPLNHLGSESW